MKKLLIIIAIFTLNIQAQNTISFSVLQDIKLGLGMDEEHGNIGFTPDVILNVNLEGKQFEWYYFSMQVQYEHAELSSGYFKRYSVHGIWNLNQLIIPKMEVGLGVGLGMINRKEAEGIGSYSGTIDISYPITKKLHVILKKRVRKKTFN